MINFPPKDLFANQTRISVSCRMAGMSTSKQYVLGDHLQGQLSLTVSKAFPIERITAKLEYVMKGKRETSVGPASEIQIAGNLFIEAHQPEKFSFRFPEEFRSANYTTPQLDAYWQFTVKIHLKKPVTGSVNNSIKSLFGDFRPVDTSYSVPVTRDRGHYQVEAKELSIKGIKTEYKFGAAFTGFFILWMSFTISLSMDQFFKVLYFLGLAAAVIFAGLSLAILKGFQRTSLTIKPRRDGALRIQFLDLGNHQYKRMIIGLRIVSRQLSNEDGRSSYRRSLLYDKSYQASDISRPEGLFREAVLPWPEEKMPVSAKIWEQGFTWEVYLRTDVFPFGAQEQAWPVEVSWEAFHIPEVGNEEMEELELQPLKETIEQRR